MKFDDKLCARHLADMIPFKTVSNADSSKMELSEFYALHEYLEKTYPLVHGTMKREVIGKAALLYTWKGSGEGKRPPVLLLAHQDVVPAGDPEKWTYPPFSATIAEGRVWGRGVCDCKANLMAHMEALEALIAEGFTPEFDVYLAYGCNEEVMGGDFNHAKALCETLRDRGVRPGIAIDEGRGPGPDFFEGIKESVAYVFTCEKGYADVEISIKDRGGHSMMPGKRSIIAELGQIAVDLMNAQYPFRMTRTVADEYALKGRFMDESYRPLAGMKEDFAAALPLIRDNPALACKFRTTMALTMMKGSAQPNILPTEAGIVMNCRLLEGDTVESLLEKVRGIVNGRAEVRLLKGGDPSGVSRTDSAGYKCLKELVGELYPETTVIPCIMTGGTDAKHYYPICDSVYRFSGFPAIDDPRAHNFDEHLFVEGLGRGPELIYGLIKRYGAYSA